MCQGYNLKFEAAPDGVTKEQLYELTKLENRKMVNLRPKMIHMTAGPWDNLVIQNSDEEDWENLYLKDKEWFRFDWK